MPSDRIKVRVASDLAPLMPRFLANRRNEVPQLEAALAQRDNATLRRIAHGMKGVGGGYGFDEITRLGAEIERCAEAGISESARPFVIALKHYLECVDVVFE